MTPDKILSVVSVYEAQLVEMGATPEQVNGDCRFSQVSTEGLLNHALHLCGSVRDILAGGEEQWGKANRHFGSLQTILSVLGWHTLDELREHNRPASAMAPLPLWEAVSTAPQ